jgi:hypothetical protein
MKKSFWAISAVVALLFATAACFGQGHTRATTKIELNGATVSVEYGRPSLGGRTFESLEADLPPNGWRLGADKSTTFSTSKDLAFGDVAIPAGEYSLWAKKDGNSWSLIFNKQHGQWGTQHDPSKDLASVPLKVETEQKSADLVTITLEQEGGGGELSIQWGTQELSTDFKVK